jgi:hypothetical protein
MPTIYEFIDDSIQNLLATSVGGRRNFMKITEVVDLLLKIEELIPEIVIDGDEFVKYFKGNQQKL